MKIAVIGAGAMGSIYGGRLSQKAQVYLLDTNELLVEKINKSGLVLEENGKDVVYRPQARLSGKISESVDLIIVFVKALYSKMALEQNKALIGDNTLIMTLQNGMGHEDILRDFVPEERIIIGTTEDNGAILGIGHVRHGGEGITNLGMLTDNTECLAPIKDLFESCGFQIINHKNIQQLIWNKLFTNISLSVVTGILQVDIGYIADNDYAWYMTKCLVKEAVNVAKAAGIEANENSILEKIKRTSHASPKGSTSIRADLNAGRKTEVDTITGSLVRLADKLNIEAPCHSFVLAMIHAMEDKKKVEDES